MLGRAFRSQLPFPASEPGTGTTMFTSSAETLMRARKSKTPAEDFANLLGSGSERRPLR
jgi:hypothetical protein